MLDIMDITSADVVIALSQSTHCRQVTVAHSNKYNAAHDNVLIKYYSDYITVKTGGNWTV